MNGKTIGTGVLLLGAALSPFACATGVSETTATDAGASTAGAGGASSAATSGTGGASSAASSGSGSDVCGGTLSVCAGACVDRANDPKHCGSCDKVCTAKSGMVPVCINGTCDAICEAGKADCNGKPDDGCEIALATDPKNCSACAKACGQVAHGQPGCAMSACVVGSCDFGWGDCNKSPDDGCETNLQHAKDHCGKCGNACMAGTSCVNGSCQVAPTNFVVQETKDIVYQGIAYLLLKVSFASTESASDTWCQDYTNLCVSYGYLPTGCGQQFNQGGYGECKSIYQSDGVSDTLGCNPSGGISSAAQQNGYFDATSNNSFGFHYCGGTCQKTMCSGDYCNTALSYVDATKPYGYTLCKK